MVCSFMLTWKVWKVVFTRGHTNTERLFQSQRIKGEEEGIWRWELKIFILNSIVTVCVLLQVMDFVKEKIGEDISALIALQTRQYSDFSPRWQQPSFSTSQPFSYSKSKDAFYNLQILMSSYFLSIAPSCIGFPSIFHCLFIITM